MAIVFDAPVSPVDLTVFMRKVPVPAENNLVPAFPSKVTPTNKVDFAELRRTNRTARFRSYDGRIHVTERDGGTLSSITLLPLSDSLNEGEYERLQQEFVKTQGTNKKLLADAIYNDAEILVPNIYNRLAQAWGDVLTDGILSINEDGFQGEADFGVPTGNKVTAATLWSNVAAPALDNLRSWGDTYTALNGDRPGAIRMTLPTLRLLQRNTQIINAIVGATPGRTSVTLAEINQLLATEMLPDITIVAVQQLDIDGVITPTLPDDRVWLTPATLGELGYSQWGLTATSLELVNDARTKFAFSDAPGIVGVIEKLGPPYRQFTFADSVVMPILSAPNRLFIAKVK